MVLKKKKQRAKKMELGMQIYGGGYNLMAETKKIDGAEKYNLERE